MSKKMIVNIEFEMEDYEANKDTINSSILALCIETNARSRVYRTAGIAFKTKFKNLLINIFKVLVFLGCIVAICGIPISIQKKDWITLIESIMWIILYTKWIWEIL